jgi:hypothetical protein
MNKDKKGGILEAVLLLASFLLFVFCMKLFLEKESYAFEEVLSYSDTAKSASIETENHVFELMKDQKIFNQEATIRLSELDAKLAILVARPINHYITVQEKVKPFPLPKPNKPVKRQNLLKRAGFKGRGAQFDL